MKWHKCFPFQFAPLKPCFHLDFFCLLLLVLVFRTSKSHNEQCDAQMETFTKNQNEQQTTFVCFGFWDRIDSISKTRKSNEEQQKATNGKWKHTPKTKTRNKKQRRAFFIPIFIHSHQFWIYGRWLVSRAMKTQKNNDGQRKAMKSSKKLRRATKSNNGHRSWKNQNGQEKNKASIETHKKSKWKPDLREQTPRSPRLLRLRLQLQVRFIAPILLYWCYVIVRIWMRYDMNQRVSIES